MLIHLRHYFHAQVKSIVEQHGERSYQLWHRAEVAFYIVYMLRYCGIGLMFSEEIEFNQYDHLASLARHHSYIYNEYFCLLVIGLILLALAGKKVFFFTHVDTLSFQIIYDICVQHTEIYWRCLKSEVQIRKIEAERREASRRRILSWSAMGARFTSWLPDVLVYTVATLWAKVDVFLKLDRVNKRKFMANSMSHFPNVSLKTRSKLIIYLHCLDFGCYVVMVSNMAFTVMEILYYTFLFGQIYPWWYFPAILPDLVIGFFLIISFIQCGLLFTLMISYCGLIYNCHFTELGATLHRIRGNVRFGRRIRRVFPPLLKHVIREHSTIIYYLVYSNRDVWGNAFFLFVVISTPVNAFMVSLILMDTMDNFELVLMIFIIVMHASIGAIPMISMAYTVKANYTISKHIVAIQLALGRDQLRIKLKLDDLFGRMSRGRKYGLTIGPMSAITFTFLFELVICYVVIFIFVLEKKRQLSRYY